MADDFSNDINTTGTVAVGGSATGNIETALDHDWFRVELLANHNYFINEIGSPGMGGTLGDPFVEVFYSDGSFTGAFNDDSGGTLDSQVPIHVTQTGTYFVDAGAFSTHTGTYTVQVVDAGPATWFQPPELGLPISFSQASGWTSENTYPRLLGDVNGDGFDDIVGFGSSGTFVSLAIGDGTFENPIVGTSAFAQTSGWTSEDAYPRLLGDVNGDGSDDIVGFGASGTFVSLAIGDGTFENPILATLGFDTNNGWTSEDAFPRLLGDINDDGRDDVVAFGSSGVFFALGQEDGTFGPTATDISAFAPNAGGWTSENVYPRLLGDVTNDGRADIVGFGSTGVYVSQAESDFVLV